MQNGWNIIMENNYPIRVLIVNGKMICGGVESFIMNIYRHIDKTKIQFDFLVHYKDKQFYDDEIEKYGGKVYRLTFRDDNNIFKYKKDLQKFFSTHKEYQIVWGQMDGLAKFYMKTAKKEGIKYTIMHSHITNSEKSIKGLLKKFLRKGLGKYTDLNLACSTEAGIYLYGRNKFSLCHNAIDTNKFRYNVKTRSIIRENLNITEDTLVVGNVGRFFPQKNHVFTVKIFEKLLEKNKNSLLLFCGDGDLLPNIKELAKKLNIEQNIRFLGNIDNVNEYYQAMDVFIMPSLYEGLPVSGIEAQTSGLPCIFSSNISRESAIIGNNCKFLSIKNPVEWANEIIKLNKNTNRQEAVQSIVENHYDIENLCEKLTNLFLLISSNEYIKREVKLYDE